MQKYVVYEDTKTKFMALLDESENYWWIGFVIIIPGLIWGLILSDYHEIMIIVSIISMFVMVMVTWSFNETAPISITIENDQIVVETKEIFKEYSSNTTIDKESISNVVFSISAINYYTFTGKMKVLLTDGDSITIYSCGFNSIKKVHNDAMQLMDAIYRILNLSVEIEDHT
ncbi:MAG: hypothetical protein WDA22_17210 [Bacteroidota bacterium]